MTVKNKKHIFQIVCFVILTVIISFLFFNTSKFDLCLSIIKYNYNLNYIGEKNSKKFKLDLLNQIDKKNQDINHYFRFSHNVIGTTSNKGECQKNIKTIIQNLKNENELNIFIEKIDFIKKIEIKKIIFFIILILAYSICLFTFSFIRFIQNEKMFTVNKNKD